MIFNPKTRQSRFVSGTALLAVACVFGGVLTARHVSAEDHSQHAGAASDKGELSEASKAYEDAMQKMHKDMTVPYSNDVDLDFVRGMMPHHQGAIDQAQVLLKYSKNLRLRRLAGGIIAAQRREINFMKHWMKEQEKGVESTEMPDWMKNAPVSPDGSPNPAETSAP